MITYIEIKNFRSFIEAKVQLQPFSLVVGANGSGKTNFLRFLSLVHGSMPKVKQRARGLVRGPLHAGNPTAITRFSDSRWLKHVQHSSLPGRFTLHGSHGVIFEAKDSSDGGSAAPVLRDGVDIFNLKPENISDLEQVSPHAKVTATGQGTAQVLDILKNGDREDLFDAIEREFRKYVPEVEKLSLKTVEQGKKQIQVRENGVGTVAASELSEGTRILLSILTIIHQENPPSMILLEDIDRGLHPRLFEYLAPLLRDIAIKHDINIVATTHNPYLVDAMQDHKDAVIIVEKKDGASTLSTLASRLEGLDYDKVDPDDLPLGQLWFSGLVGGVPKSLSSRPAK